MTVKELFSILLNEPEVNMANVWSSLFLTLVLLFGLGITLLGLIQVWEIQMDNKRIEEDRRMKKIK